MSREKKKPAARGRFSLFSLVCLFLCWIVGTLIAFVAGYVLGKGERTSPGRAAQTIFERPGDGPTNPPLTFHQLLEEGDARSAGAPRSAPAPAERRAVRNRSDASEAPVGLAGSSPSSQDDVPVLAEEEGPPGARWVQVASFREPGKARGLAQSLREKGYPGEATASALPASGATVYRVMVGPFSTPEEARRRKAELERDEGFQGLFIRSGAP